MQGLKISLMASWRNQDAQTTIAFAVHWLSCQDLKQRYCIVIRLTKWLAISAHVTQRLILKRIHATRRLSFASTKVRSNLARLRNGSHSYRSYWHTQKTIPLRIAPPLMMCRFSMPPKKPILRLAKPILPHGNKTILPTSYLRSHTGANSFIQDIQNSQIYVHTDS